jgi:hypothetical protein
MRMIGGRPRDVDDRVQAGHWEGDLIMGPGNRSAIGTLLERSTRFLILLAFPDGIATTQAVRHGIEAAFTCLPAGLRRTLTWDQGKELALHQQITAATGTDVFFCDAHAPWQRGSNENMNGLLRDYFPKGTDIGALTTEDLARIAAEANDLPRQDARLVSAGGPVHHCDRIRLTPPGASGRVAALPRPTPAALAASLRQRSRSPPATTSGEGGEWRSPASQRTRRPTANRLPSASTTESC